jgi:ceramide synthetase
MGLIIATFFALLIIIIQSRKYNEFLNKINPNYHSPTIFEMIMNTTILTIILLVGKVLIEKLFHCFCEMFLDKKYEEKEYLSEKPKAKRKLSIYSLKFLHYLILTIHSYFIYDQLDFFPKELFGHGNMYNLYINDIHSLAFFKRPKYFDFHYYLNLAYTFADLFCVVFIYDRQTDILVMAFHHFCTITLMVFSLYNHFDSIGSIILFSHNVSDIFVYFGRTLLYTRAPNILKKLFSVCLLISFVYCRLFVYGKLIYDYFIYVNWETFYLQNAFQIALLSLYTLHCTWTYKLVRIAFNSIVKSKFNDSRQFIKDNKSV